jgi:hypothetical protein
MRHVSMTLYKEDNGNRELVYYADAKASDEQSRERLEDLMLEKAEFYAAGSKCRLTRHDRNGAVDLSVSVQ